MEKFYFSRLAAALLLAGCETKRAKTKGQLAEASQAVAVMARTGKTAADTVSGAGAAVNTL